MELNKIHNENCLDTLARMPDEFVDCVVTSPPYFGLRDYGGEPSGWGGDPNHAHEWNEHIAPAANGLINNVMQGETLSDASATRRPRSSGFCDCGAWLGSYGLEPTPQLFIEHTVLIFNEICRVLKKDGTVWLNLGDSYAGSGRGRNADGSHSAKETDKQFTNAGSTNGRLVNEKSFSKKLIEQGAIGNAWVKPPQGFKPKDLMMIPHRVAIALQDSGWYVRQDIVWSKPNPMPESVTDRCTKSHEYIFLLTKSQRYYFDHEAIQEQANYDGRKAIMMQGSQKYADGFGPTDENTLHVEGHERWKFKTKSTFGNRDGEHDRLHSGKEWTPQYKNLEYDGQTPNSFHISRANGESDELYAVRNKRSVWTVSTKPFADAHFATFPPEIPALCIKAGCPVGGIVYDPFSGAGTTALVAHKLGRNWIGSELNSEYVELANKRLAPYLAQKQLF